jgi:signal transduction histidine kinase
MGARKPSLRLLIARHYLWAMLATLVVLLLFVLAITDGVMLYARRNALSEQLYAVESVSNAMLMLYEVNGAGGSLRAGSLLLDAEGHWVSGPDTDGQPVATGSERPAIHRWIEAAEINRRGGLHGMNRLPWTKDVVIWAARPIFSPDGESQILVAWEQVTAIRLATTPVYITVIVTSLLAFGICAFIGLRTVRNITRVLDGIAESSSRMAAGDYQIRLPSQPAEELDRVSHAITSLAQNLEETTSALRAEHERLSRLEGLQRQFVADASHELRAPLTAMRVTLEAWQDGVLTPEEEPQALEQMLSEVERQGQLVARLLHISRIESGREMLNSEPVDVRAVAERVARAAMGTAGPPVTVAIGDVPFVQGDLDAIWRMLTNFVENARRFTPDDGTVRIWAVVEDDAVRVAVTDTGCGIDPDFLPRVWDRFARDPRARAEGKAGSGLGLAIVAGLAQQMHGSVGVESTLGAGTTMWVRLPIAAE